MNKKLTKQLTKAVAGIAFVLSTSTAQAIFIETAVFCPDNDNTHAKAHLYLTQYEYLVSDLKIMGFVLANASGSTGVLSEMLPAGSWYSEHSVSSPTPIYSRKDPTTLSTMSVIFRPGALASTWTHRVVSDIVPGNPGSSGPLQISAPGCEVVVTYL